MTLLALFAAATLFGGMLLYSFGFAPLVFSKLPVQQAGALLREAFPFYYLFVIAVALVAGVALLAVDTLSAWLMFVTLVIGVAARQLLMPAINRASDARAAGDESAGGAFKRLHGFSVVLNFVQLAAVGTVLARFV